MEAILTSLFTNVNSAWGVIVLLAIMLSGLLYGNHLRDQEDRKSVKELTDKVNDLVTSQAELTGQINNLFSIFINNLKIK